MRSRNAGANTENEGARYCVAEAVRLVDQFGEGLVQVVADVLVLLLLVNQLVCRGRERGGRE